MSPLLPLDRDRLREALALAESSFGLTEPNPRVGCVIGLPDGRVLGRGATQQAGGPHAEVMALRDAAAAGHPVDGATAWVGLEPCAHHGRTPPCADALVAAGIGRVVVAVGDPFPKVAGAGLARLRAAGIAVALASESPAPEDRELAAAAREINIGFFSRIERGRPFVRVKLAASLDGRTALPNGRSQWITGPEARADGHAWRRRASTVLTGIGTVLADDPRLDVRLVPSPRQPQRLVLDPRWRTPPGARVLQAPGAACIVGCGDPPEDLRRRVEEQGGSCRPVQAGGDGRVDLPTLLVRLAADAVNELHVEAGAVLSGAFIAAGLADELLVYVAPRLLGDGRGLAAIGPYATPDAAPGWHWIGCTPVGADLRLRLRPA